MIFLENNAYMTNKGNVANKEPTMMTPHSVFTGLSKDRSANGMVKWLLLRNTTRAPEKLFHEAMKLINPRTLSAGINKGIKIFIKMRHSVAPSILAASIMSFVMLLTAY